MTVSFVGKNDRHLDFSNGTADALLKSIGHDGLGPETCGSMPVSRALELLATTQSDHPMIPVFRALVHELAETGAKTLVWF